MPERRPLGVTILSALFTFIGGVASFGILLDVIDSLRFFGLSSLAISSPAALLGFMMYAGAPVAFYATGIGLFSGSKWARYLVVRVDPIFIFFFFFNVAYTLGRKKPYLQHALPLKVMMASAANFSQIILLGIIIIAFLMMYFNKPSVKNYFE